MEKEQGEDQEREPRERAERGDRDRDREGPWLKWQEYWNKKLREGKAMKETLGSMG